MKTATMSSQSTIGSLSSVRSIFILTSAIDTDCSLSPVIGQVFVIASFMNYVGTEVHWALRFPSGMKNDSKFSK